MTVAAASWHVPEVIVFGLIVGLVIVGLIAGAVARLLIPGRQNIGILMTIVLGIVGSFVGGFLGYVLFGHDKAGGFVQTSGWIGSIIGAVIVMMIYTRMGSRHTTR